MNLQPVIPDYGTPSPCVQNDGFFCGDWFLAHWSNTFAPALVQHIQLTAIAIVIGFIIAFAAAIYAHAHDWFAKPFGALSAFLYTIPPLALFELLVPATGLSVLTVEVALVAYTLLVLFRNIRTGLAEVDGDVRKAGRGMGLTDRQILLKLELPLALPAIIGGLRVATVSTISIVEIAAFIIDQGLGSPIVKGLVAPFSTQFVAAGVLAILLALAADASLVLTGRILTPWARARRAV
jgi:osmoprotectant transport system permease protein